MSTFRIWRNTTVLAQINLIDDQTIVVERDGVETIGIDADGNVTTWDDTGTAFTTELKRKGST